QDKVRSIPLALQWHHVREVDDLATPYRWARRAAGPRPPPGAARRRGAAGGEGVPRRDLGAYSLRPVGSSSVAGLPARPAGARLARRREPVDRSRWAEGDAARLPELVPELAAELVRLKV